MSISDHAPVTETHIPSHDDLDTAGREGLFTQMGATLRGPMRPWIIYVWIMGTAFTIIAIWAAVSFFSADVTRDLVLYATIFLACCMMVCLAKVWYYIQAAQYANSRQLERLERRFDNVQR